MTDQLITFETAKLAYEKGFRGGNGRKAYNKEGRSISVFSTFNYSEEKYPITTTSQPALQKWLRDKQSIHICIDVEMDQLPNSLLEFNFYLFKRGHHESKWSVTYKTYEAALEAALQEALKLIKDV